MSARKFILAHDEARRRAGSIPARAGQPLAVNLLSLIEIVKEHKSTLRVNPKHQQGTVNRHRAPGRGTQKLDRQTAIARRIGIQQGQ